MNKFTSLEHMIRNVMAEAISKGTEKRRTVKNVGRPDDGEPMSDKSKISKQGEIITKIIDEVIGDIGPNAPIDNENFKIGDMVHAGFGVKGGAGYKGKVHHVDGTHVYLHTGNGKFGPRIVKAPKHLVTKEEDLSQFNNPTDNIPSPANQNSTTPPAAPSMPNVWSNTPQMFQPKMPKISESAIPMGDVETTGKDDSGKGTDEKKNKKKTGAESDHDDPKMIKGGKTEVILKPHTDDSSRDESQEKMDSDKARRKANKEIGQKGAPVKEETIFESTSDAHSHMKKAMKCYEAGDIGGHHAHMANYHHIMSGHHARAGRHHVADAHVKRAEYHMDEAAKFGPLDTAGPDAKAGRHSEVTNDAIKASSRSSHADAPFEPDDASTMTGKTKNIAKNLARKSMKAMVKKVSGKTVSEGTVPEPKARVLNHGLTNSDAAKLAKVHAMLSKEKKPVKKETLDEKNWIAGAIKHPGSLHRALHVPADEKIPAGKLEKASHSENPKLRRKAILAKTLKKLKEQMYGGELNAIQGAGNEPAARVTESEGWHVKHHPVFGKVLAHNGDTRTFDYDTAEKHATRHGGMMFKSPYDSKKYIVKMPETLPHGQKVEVEGY